jgi:hypothetical protein
MVRRNFGAGHRAQDMEHGAWSMGHGAWGMEHGAWSMEHGAQGLELRAYQAWKLKKPPLVSR